MSDQSSPATGTNRLVPAERPKPATTPIMVGVVGLVIGAFISMGGEDSSLVIGGLIALAATAFLLIGIYRVVGAIDDLAMDRYQQARFRVEK